jgi:hypothetical protein
MEALRFTQRRYTDVCVSKHIGVSVSGCLETHLGTRLILAEGHRLE